MMQFGDQFMAWKLSSDDWREQKKAARQRLANAVVAAHEALYSLQQLELLKLTDDISKKKIRRGTAVVIAFADGPETCMYDGLEWNRFRLRHDVVVRRKVKRGWSKKKTRYRSSVLDIMATEPKGEE